jgi:hypothetical protein
VTDELAFRRHSDVHQRDRGWKRDIGCDTTESFQIGDSASEAALRVELFQRSGGHVKSTEVARSFYERIVPLVGDLVAASRILRPPSILSLRKSIWCLLCVPAVVGLPERTSGISSDF